MTARVTIAEVKDILSTGEDDDTVTACITAATNLIDELFADETGIGTAHLKEIERWTAAHFLAIIDPVIKSEKLGDAAVTYHGAISAGAKGLEWTPYGLAAIALDTTGRLAKSGKKRATFKSVDLNL